MNDLNQKVKCILLILCCVFTVVLIPQISSAQIPAYLGSDKASVDYLFPESNKNAYQPLKQTRTVEWKQKRRFGYFALGMGTGSAVLGGVLVGVAQSDGQPGYFDFSKEITGIGTTLIVGGAASLLTGVLLLEAASKERKASGLSLGTTGNSINVQYTF